MGWTFDSTKQTLPVVKENGLCRRSALHKFCPYWVAKHPIEVTSKKQVLGYRCRLFEEDKEGYASLPVCNTAHGLNYDGPPKV